MWGLQLDFSACKVYGKKAGIWGKLRADLLVWPTLRNQSACLNNLFSHAANRKITVLGGPFLPLAFLLLQFLLFVLVDLLWWCPKVK
jgi:hypothetical protein